MAVVVSGSDGLGGADGDETQAGPRSEARGGGGSPPPLLEHSQNVVTGEGEREYEVSSCGCDCWYCPDCCKRKGYNLRAELVPILTTFRGLMMLTLTIDPELFPTARDAYLYLRKQRGISRLMRELDGLGHLHSRRYFYVVEFQQRTEQAHFHVLVDASHIPKAAIDAAWSRLRPRWAGPVSINRPAFGMTRFSVGTFAGGALHAARYATKYLVKTPEHGWPAWVMGMGKDRRVPRYQTSRGFWQRDTVPSTPTGKTREALPRTYADRLAECGMFSNLFGLTERIDHETGEVQRERAWLARLGLSEDRLRELLPDARAGRLRMTLRAGSVGACIDALRLAVGEPIRVISGLGVAGARP
ncbi:MAG: hypothetical protein KF902_04105 [Phycisphaeraceae bacterium]|nr:hypothetical protein [Phycisphaeraceae bacterium]MCW5768760.1 hypothetical protein [Phycisphaeraceae bacterium]